MVMKVICVVALIACLFIAYCSWTINVHKPINTKKNCVGTICPPLIERKVNSMLDWLFALEWYWFAAIIAALAGIYWFFVK